MKFLVGIPCLSGADHCRAAIESVIFKNNTHVLLIDNGAEKSVKNLLSSFFGMRNADIIHNEKNIYVNPAWNQILDFFLNHSNCDYLLIMNSDLIVHKHWDIVLKEFLFRHSDTIPVPVISGDHESVKKDIGLNEFKYTEVFQGTPGVCLSLIHI